MENTMLWLQNLKELKKKSNMSIKDLAIKSHMPERSVARIIGGETEHPRIDTLYDIVTALGGTMSDIFADTNIIVATEELVEIKENVGVMEAEKDVLLAENKILTDKVNTLTAEIELLKLKLMHKDELLALHNYYNKIKSE